MNITAIIQARMTSTRLPGKILLEVGGKSLLEILIIRLKKSKKLNNIIIATTENHQDDVIIDFCKKNNISYFRGSENNVLSRYYKATLKYNTNIIVRITSDCPLIDPEIVDNTIKHYLNQEKNIDYVSNCLERTFPLGMDTEVFSMKTLAKTHKEAYKPYELEHVTPYIYQNPDKFKISTYKNPTNQENYRLTVDTAEDFQLIKKIIENLYPHKPNFNIQDIITLLKNNPDWVEINQHIIQKTIEKET